MDDYRSLLHVVAENPGATGDELDSITAINDTGELLDTAEEKRDIICVSERYWVVRKGEFAVEEYDHP